MRVPPWKDWSPPVGGLEYHRGRTGDTLVTLSMHSVGTRGTIKWLLDEASLSRLFACFPPTGEEPVHQGMETGVVAGLKQVAQFVDHNVLYAPFGQQQQVDGEADAAVLSAAPAPSRCHWLVGNGRWTDVHLLGMSRQHRRYQVMQSCLGFCLLCRGGQRQPVVEVGLLPLPGAGLLPCCRYPVAVLFDEGFHPRLGQAYRCRHMYVAVLDDTHRQSARPTVSDEHRKGLSRSHTLHSSLLTLHFSLTQLSLCFEQFGVGHL